MKHIDLQLYWLQEKFCKGIVHLMHYPTADLPADLLIKVLISLIRVSLWDLSDAGLRRSLFVASTRSVEYSAVSSSLTLIYNNSFIAISMPPLSLRMVYPTAYIFTTFLLCLLILPMFLELSKGYSLQCRLELCIFHAFECFPIAFQLHFYLCATHCSLNGSACCVPYEFGCTPFITQI